MTINEFTGTSWDELPEVVRTFLVAQSNSDVGAATAAFAADAEVTDEGHTHRGRPEIKAWLRRAGREYTYTTEFTHATMAGADQVDVVQHLEGDFPGGVADLHFRFTLDGGRVRRLVIEP
ncbi:nuclear transport factor 2 family protein [Mycobacterium sp. SMC-4]|uniref:nuclear transport factor 2 family protein n=1 Tax=Mycobacterium sp. SMC-4 TaxID=2857059 RepID=UPI003D0359B1